MSNTDKVPIYVQIGRGGALIHVASIYRDHLSDKNLAAVLEGVAAELRRRRDFPLP